MAVEIVVAGWLGIFVLVIAFIWYMVSGEVAIATAFVSVLVGLLYVLILVIVKDFSTVASVTCPGV